MPSEPTSFPQPRVVSAREVQSASRATAANRKDAMSTHVVNEFHALPDRADDVMNLLIELSPISRTRLGCQAISVRRNQDDPTNIVGDTRWDTRQDYDNYLAWRTDSGYTAQFEEMLAEPMSIRYFEEVRAW
jgi:quinol monooxygenase YgiN